MHLSKLAFVQSVLLGHCLATTLVHSVRLTSWKHWPIRLNSVGPSSFLASESLVKIFNLRSRSINVRKHSGQKSCLVGRDVSCNILCSFLKSDFDMMRLFHAFFDPFVWQAICTQRSLANVPVKLGCLLSLNEIQHHQDLGCLHVWVFIALLLDRAGLSTSAKSYYNSDFCSSRKADRLLECIVESDKKIVCRSKNKEINLLWVTLLSVWCAVVGGIFTTAPS